MITITSEDELRNLNLMEEILDRLAFNCCSYTIKQFQAYIMEGEGVEFDLKYLLIGNSINKVWNELS